MDNEFDVEINADYHRSVFDTQSNIISDVLGGAVATIVDVGASLWNSIPMADDVDTGQLLARISNNALRVYEENTDTIETASFIGGLLIPGTAAIKGVNALRNGSKAVNWFTKAGREASQKELEMMFKNGMGETTAYRDKVRALYGKGLANQVVDAAAAEVAILGTFNAHPFMEDYLEDPVQNFGISLALGSVIGGAIGHIGDRFAVRAFEGSLSKEAFDATVGKLRDVPSHMTNTTALQSYEVNLGNLRGILSAGKAEGKDETNDLAMSYATKAMKTLQERQLTLFDAMLTGDLTNLPKEAKDKLFQALVKKQEFHQVDSLSPLTERQVEGIGLSPTKSKAASDTTEPAFVKKVTKKDGTAAEVETKVAWFPDMGIIAPVKEAPHLAPAAALGKTLDQWEKEVSSVAGRLPNHDAPLELVGKATARAEGEYFGLLARFDKVADKNLADLVVAEDDIHALTALIARLDKSPTGYKTKVRIASDTPQTTESLLEKQTAAAAPNLGPDGRPISYAKSVEKFTSPEVMATTGLDATRRAATSHGLSYDAADMLKDWVAGNGVARMRRAASDWLGAKTGGFGRMGTDEVGVKLFDEIYNHPKSAAFREEFSKVADQDGMVLLYRGSRQEARGHAPLESYTADPIKASEFGTPRLYRVHVDDIVTGFLDIPNKYGIRRNEFIVRAGARPVEAKLDKAGRATFLQKAKDDNGPAKLVLVQPGSKEVYRSELYEKLIESKERVVLSMIKAGTPLYTIMRKTNTPMDTIQALVTGSHSLDELVNVHGMRLHNVANVKEAEEALSVINKPLGLSGDTKKANYTARHSQLDNIQLTAMNKEILSSVYASSESDLARGIGQYLFQDQRRAVDILREQIGWVNNSTAGSRFWNSSDFWARNMKDAGIIANFFGKEFEHMRTNAIKRVVDPIARRFSDVTKDATAVYEANLFFNVNSSVSGYRVYRDRQLFRLVPGTGAGGKPIMMQEAVEFQGKALTIVDDKVDAMILELQAESKELLALANTKKKALGQPPVNDIGLWVPSFNPVNKFLAYVHDTATDKTSVIIAKTDKELADLVLAAKTWAKDKGLTNLQIFDKSDQKAFSLLNGRLDPVFMQRADVTQFKKGSAQDFIPKATLEVFSDIAAGYEHYITAQTRQLVDIAMSDITTALDRMSARNRALFENQPLDKVSKALRQPVDAAAVMKNTLLGNPNLKEYSGWQSANETFETTLALGTNIVQRTFATLLEPIAKYTVRPVRQEASSLFDKAREMVTGKKTEKVLDVNSLKKMDYEVFAKALEERGIPNVYAAFDDAAAKHFGLARLEDHKDVSKRLVYGSNALAATAILRVGEIAQPVVNAMSLPILTALASASRMPETFMGAALKTGNVPIGQVMTEGIRAMNSPRFTSLSKRWENLGYFTPMVSEVTNLQRSTRSFEKGAISALENALDSKMVELMSKPADYSESLVRKMTMFTGYTLAKRLYPELDDAGATIFARDFMDKAVGNFHASQRPVFFQGTLGVAMGLFQTYILTLGQSIYRQLELKNYKALGKATLLQGTIFGAQSLPGFHPISTLIGEHFSDEHIDLTTGTYRAIGDEAADLVLYGLPSNLGPALFTRGDISVRPPNILGGMQNTVAVSFLGQTLDMLGEIQRSLSQDNASMGRAFAQALSLQSISRPLARGAELATGYSIDRAGNTVQVPEEVWTPTGIISRVMSTRPFEEAKYRQANHLHSYYGAIDREARQGVTKKLRTAIREGTLSDEEISSYAEDYFRKGGTPTGWKAAYREAVARTEESGKQHLLEKLSENSPLNFMISNLE